MSDFLDVLSPSTSPIKLPSMISGGEFPMSTWVINHLFYCSINTEISQELLNTGHFEIMTVEADEDEHSIEMQLPYIAKVGEESSSSFSRTINVSYR